MCPNNGSSMFATIHFSGASAVIVARVRRVGWDQESHRKTQATHKAVAMMAATAIATVISGKRAPMRRQMLGLRCIIGRYAYGLHTHFGKSRATLASRLSLDAAAVRGWPSRPSSTEVAPVV